MKLFKLISSLLLLSSISVNAQSKAIGLRLGGGNISGAEISYQMPIGGENNRLELDLGFGGSDDYTFLGLSGTYQWVFPIQEVKGLAWYAGPGATLGLWSVDIEGLSDNGFNIGIGGTVGIEYTFDAAPIQLSLDTRPMFNIIGADDYNGYWGVALGARYIF